MDITEFNEIRPYYDEELPQILEELIADQAFQKAACSAIPNVPFELLAQKKGISYKEDPRRMQLLRIRIRDEAVVAEARVRFDELKATVDKAKAKAYFEAIEGTKLIPPKVPVKYDKLLREFIVSGGFDLKMPKES